MQGRPTSEHAFDRVAGLYDGWFSTPLGQEVDQLEKSLLYRLMQPRACEKVLDVGTGTGHYVGDLTALGLPAVGVDLSSEMLGVARSKGPQWALIRGDAAALPVVAGRFDIVLAVTALEFVADPRRTLAEMWRAVAPGGRMVVAALNAWSPWAWARRREARTVWTPFADARFFRPGEFVQLLRPFGGVHWSSSVFVGPSGEFLRWRWVLEHVGRVLLKQLGALLVGMVRK